MKITGYEDLRVQRTISNIYKAFEDLICEKEYQKITVKELSELAQITKKRSIVIIQHSTTYYRKCKLNTLKNI
jgi:hypothetical protein